MGSVGPISIDDLGEICIANLRFPSWYFASLVWYECVCCYVEGRQAWGHCLLGRWEGDLVYPNQSKKQNKRFGFLLEAFGFSNHSL